MAGMYNITVQLSSVVWSQSPSPLIHEERSDLISRARVLSQSCRVSSQCSIALIVVTDYKCFKICSLETITESHASLIHSFYIVDSTGDSAVQDDEIIKTYLDMYTFDLDTLDLLKYKISSFASAHQNGHIHQALLC